MLKPTPYDVFSTQHFKEGVVTPYMFSNTFIHSYELKGI